MTTLTTDTGFSNGNGNGSANDDDNDSAEDQLTWHQTFTQRVPKIDLHAHLNGSIRRSTLSELASSQNLDANTSRIVSGDARSLVEMFSVFNVIHKAVRGPSVLRRIAREVLEDFASDGVVYLELRTTPRAHSEWDMDEEGYVRAVLDGFQDYAAAAGVKGQQEQTTTTTCDARLLLSIDRKDPPSTSQRTVDLAMKYQSQGVVGIDLSGDPSKGTFSQWVPALTRARQHGLKISLHAGELDNTHDEMAQMLEFNPDRFGHVCFLSPSNAKTLRSNRTPLELCLTSNILTHAPTIPSYADHHFLQHHKLNEHPVVLCTDDTAVFGTTLSKEYAIAMDAFGLRRDHVRQLVLDSVQSTFLTPQEKEHLHQRVSEALHSA